MSNQAVGGVYQSIIEDVINSSRVDFEESGVDDSVLEDLRKVWQQKLSQLDVASFPWDPKPEPPPPAQPVSAPQAPSQTHSQAQFSPELSLPSVGMQNGIKQEPGLAQQDGIKQEPGPQANVVLSFPSYNGIDSKNSVAASRAAQQLQLQYGMRAAGSINAIQDRMGQQAQQAQQAHRQAQQAHQQAQQAHQQAQQAHQQAQQAQQQAQRPSHPQAGQAATQQGSQGPDVAANRISNGQTDGAGDEDDRDGSLEGALLERGVDGEVRELGRVEIDRMLHEQMVAKAKAMEGGGLMLPLKEAIKGRTARAKGKGKDKGVAAFDGGDDGDDDVDDEDAINSDLDDPEEDHEDDEVDDEGLGHIMLCMYDKVQRVKNKWKCTLKDGVLTVNGKEYVFHKATGEYEW